MNDLDEYALHKKAIGKRFKFFREVTWNTKKYLEWQTSNEEITEKQISLIECGAIMPNVIFIQYFTENYGLNLTWLVTGEGKMCDKDGRFIPYVARESIKAKDYDSSGLSDQVIFFKVLIEPDMDKWLEKYGNSNYYPGGEFDYDNELWQQP